MIVYVHEHKCFYNTKIYTYAGFLHAKPINFESFPHIVIRRRQCVTLPSVGKNGKPCFTSLLREKEG